MKTEHYVFWSIVFGLLFFGFFNGICISAKVNLANNHLKQVFLLHSVVRIPYNVQYVLLKFGLIVPFSVFLLYSFLRGVQKSQQFRVCCEHKVD